MPPKSKTPRKKESGKATPAAATEERFQQVDVSTRDPRTVVLMLDSPEATIVCRACEALNNHVTKSREENCVELKEIGVVPRLVQLLASPDRAVRSYAVLCLASMVTNGSVRGQLLKCECVPSLLALVHSDEELITQERASFTLAQLAVEYSFKVQLHANSAHDPLLKLLSSSDPDVQRNCVQALSLLAENYQCRPAVLEAGGLPALLDLLTSEYPIIQQLALNTLHSCMHHGNGLVAEKRCCPAMAYQRVSVLSLCLEEAESLVALQSSGCLQQLLSHIKESSSQDMKRNSAMALAKAATDAVNLKLLHEQEVEVTFLQLLSSEDDGVVVAGCDGLRAMSSLNSSRQVIGQQEGLSALVQCTEREQGNVRTAAVSAVAAIITDSPANCQLLGTCGGVEALVHLLSDSECACRHLASLCITNMAPNSALRSDLIAEGAVEGLVKCLTFADSAVQSSACEALGMLACDSSARQELSRNEASVSSLLSLVSSPIESAAHKAVWTLSVCAQSATISEQVCSLGGLELIKKLTTHQSTAGAALSKILGSNLPAKYWTTGYLSQHDIISDMEFYDAGLVVSSSSPFTPLTQLVNTPLNKNQPIVTVNLLTKPAPSADEGVDPANHQLDASQSTLSTAGRSRSRQQQGGGANRGKKGRTERESESRISEASVEVEKAPPVASSRDTGLLPLDSGLWTHIKHTHTHIQPLTSVRDQVVTLAKYVSDRCGGVLERGGSLGYELPAGELQYHHHSNLVPLGEVSLASFQHRALLFKVLCDQLGVGCSLVRGDYGRHWNEVWLADNKRNVTQYVVDLTFDPGALHPACSTSAVQYQRLT